MAKKVISVYNLKKVIYTALLVGNISLVGCNVKTETNNNLVDNNVATFDAVKIVNHNGDGTDSISYAGTNGGKIVEENGRVVEVVANNSPKKTFTEEDYINSLANRIKNYNVDCLVDNKTYSNFLYNPKDKEMFYAIREQYGNRMAELDDSNIALGLYDDARGHLDGLLDKSIIDYSNTCTYAKEHEAEINDLYDEYKDFDYFRNMPHETLHDLDKYVGIYNADGYSVRATQYSLDIIDPDEGLIITIYPEKNNGNIGAVINERTIVNLFGEEYCKELLNSNIPIIDKNVLIEHGCNFNLHQ